MCKRRRGKRDWKGEGKKGRKGDLSFSPSPLLLFAL
jgi:hypothetical protein